MSKVACETAEGRRKERGMTRRSYKGVYAFDTGAFALFFGGISPSSRSLTRCLGGTA